PVNGDLATFTSWKFQQHSDSNQCDDADWNVQPQTPTPAWTVSEPATKQWAKDGGQSENGTHNAHVLCALTGGGDIGGDCLRQNHQATTCDTLQSTSHNQGGHVLSQSTDDGTHHEQRDGKHEK